MNVDIVYTWVNEADPKWRKLRDESLQQCRPEDNYSVDAFRFRDNGELKYSLRSVEMYAPFVRRIYIVHGGDLPAWLNTKANGLVTVPTQEILPEAEMWPTFNSATIEAYLHRLPGLSEHYIYFNDDCFLGRRHRIRDFFDDVGRALPSMRPRLIARYGKPSLATYRRVQRNSVDALNRGLDWQLGPVHVNQVFLPVFLRRVLFGQLPLNPPTHTAQPFRKSMWESFHKTFETEIRLMARYRFRSRYGYATNLMAHHFAKSQGLAVFNYNHDHVAIMSGSSDWKRQQAKLRILQGKAAMFCINDGLKAKATDWGNLVNEIGEALFPTPSCFENRHKPSAPQVCYHAGYRRLPYEAEVRQIKG